VLARAAVRLFCTQEPAPKEGDSWAQAPVSETGLLVSVGVKRRTPRAVACSSRCGSPSPHTETDARRV
jgi:hypothetical protein